MLVDFQLPSYTTNHVLIDNLSGSKEAMNHLISLGHQRIGFVAGSSTHPSILERYEGFRQVMNEHYGDSINDIDKLSYLNEEEASPQIGREGALELLRLPDTRRRRYSLVMMRPLSVVIKQLKSSVFQYLMILRLWVLMTWMRAHISILI